MADDNMPGDETTEPTPAADRPAPRSPWEPAPSAGPSPWATEQSSWSAPADAPAPVPPPAPPPPPGPAEPAAAAEVTDNPLASPDAWVNPLAEEEARGAAFPADGPRPEEGQPTDRPIPAPPPAWQIGDPGQPAWGEPTVPVATRPTAGRRSFLLAAATGAVVGALVAGLVVAAVKDDDAESARPPAFSNNTSQIARAGDVQEILSKIEPAVVSIRTRTLSLGDFLRPVPGQGAGTGFVIASDGVIVTNNHVIAGAQSIEVVFADDRKMPARVLGRDPATDLAVMKVDAADLPVATLGDSAALKVGDDVIAIGNALGLQGGPTVTRGIVSAEDRTITAENGTRLEHVIQTDTAINPGNSGGPLVNSSGEVVGINTAVAGDAQNIGFSIAINAAKPIIEELRQGTTRSRPFLGVKMFTLTPSIAEELGLKPDSGALVAEVTPGSAAEVAGLANGDVITSIDGKEVKAAEDVTTAVNARKPGEEIKVTYRRGEEETKEATVKLGERPVDAG